MTKIGGVLAYEGLKPPKEYGLFIKKKRGAEWLHGFTRPYKGSYIS